MTVQAVITQRKSLDRNVIGKNERLRTPAPSLGARLSISLSEDAMRVIIAMQQGFSMSVCVLMCVTVRRWQSLCKC